MISIQPSANGLLIDWLTLRCPIVCLGDAVQQKLLQCMDTVTSVDSDGEVRWQKKHLDLEKLRSDSPGLFWTVQSDGKADYLVAAGSPASLHFGVNVFGSLDIRANADVLRHTAQKALGAILPPLSVWQCRRIDITGNYALPDEGSVKQALRALLNTDGVRRKASSHAKGGDSVYWSPTSDLRKGKAYHKGPHLRMMARRREDYPITLEQLELADRLLRLEHTLGARWFRRLQMKWQDITEEQLQGIFNDYFEPLTGGLEVKDMGRYEIVQLIQEKNGCTEGLALSAFTTYRNIKADGFEETKASMRRSNWFKHLKLLRTAGFTDAQLCAGNVIPFQSVRIILAQPVANWEQLRRTA